ncbi:hypothetical protein P0078_09940 [Microbulbifer sp. VAAF005]|nr:hypothetical protein [Microbulbifer sp. VAAF005]WHI48662.1 hypothetical protein P0078_09940 [Microbulbifer sp. VAAF005]
MLSPLPLHGRSTAFSGRRRLSRWLCTTQARNTPVQIHIIFGALLFETLDLMAQLFNCATQLPHFLLQNLHLIVGFGLGIALGSGW